MISPLAKVFVAERDKVNEAMDLTGIPSNDPAEEKYDDVNIVGDKAAVVKLVSTGRVEAALLHSWRIHSITCAWHSPAIRLRLPRAFTHSATSRAVCSPRPPAACSRTSRAPDARSRSSCGSIGPAPCRRGSAAPPFSPICGCPASRSVSGVPPDVYVAPFPPTGAKWQISTGGGTTPRWSRDGQELFSIRPGPVTSTMMAARVDGRGSAIRRLDVTPLFTVITASGRSAYAAAPDGKRFLINVPVGTTETPAPATVVVDWPALRGSAGQ